MKSADHSDHEGHEMGAATEPDAHAGHDMSAAQDEHAGHGGGGGHDKHEGHDPEMFRRLFWWNLLLAIPVLAFSEQIQNWFGYSIDGAWAAWVAPVVGTSVYLWGGKPFLLGGLREIQNRQPAMMLLISLAITVAYVASVLASLGVGDIDFWWELAALIVVMLLGHWQEMKAIGQAKGALSALAELIPDIAEKVVGDGTEPVPVSQLVVGDVVLVRPGDRVPADGVISDGSAAFDESMITGESRAVRRAEGDRVVAGTVSTDSSVRVRIDAIGEDTAIAGIQRLVADAQSSQSKVQALADRAAAALFYLAVGAAVATLLIWMAVGDGSEGLIRTVTVLVIACPHALGLAIPLVISISTATSAQAGILVKDRLALERMRGVDAVLFDKTGTLTKGNHAVVAHTAIEGWDPKQMLALAGAAEADSEHPLARAIVTAAKAQGDVAKATDFEALTGLGVRATVEGRDITVGGPALLEHHGLTEPTEFAEKTGTWRSQGSSVIYVLADGEVVGALTLADEIRPESKPAIDALHERGVMVVLITGDAQQVADGVAAQLGIDEVFAEVLPKDKDSKVIELQERGLTVAMVGDGVNDAPALARADVGIAIGAGTDVAIESAGVVLASSDPRSVTGIIDLSKATYRKMVQNLVWATGYNLLAIPIAAGAFSFIGLSLPPAAAAVAMSLSTVIVAANAQLLRRLDLRPEPLEDVEMSAKSPIPKASTPAI